MNENGGGGSGVPRYVRTGGGGITKGRYAVFAGETYYPDAGWLGHYASFDTFELARKSAEELVTVHHFDWWQIVDLYSQKIVDSNGESYESMFSMRYFKEKHK